MPLLPYANHHSFLPLHILIFEALILTTRIPPVHELELSRDQPSGRHGYDSVYPPTLFIRDILIPITLWKRKPLYLETALLERLKWGPVLWGDPRQVWKFIFFVKFIGFRIIMETNLWTCGGVGRRTLYTGGTNHGLEFQSESNGESWTPSFISPCFLCVQTPHTPAMSSWPDGLYPQTVIKNKPLFH